MTSPYTLLVGCGFLGQKLARSLLQQGPLDILTRSYHREDVIKALLKNAPSHAGGEHFVRDIGNSRFAFPLQKYQRIIYTPAVSVDRRLTQAAHKIHFKGTRNFLNQCRKHQFQGQFVMVGCALALTRQTDKPCPDITDESVLTSFAPQETTPQWEQFKLFSQYRKSKKESHPFIFCGLLYQREKYPEPKSIQGLTVTTRDPDTWMNLIHVQDATSAILHIIQENSPDDTILTDGNPLTRLEYYRALTKHFGHKAIRFVPDKNQPEPTRKLRSLRTYPFKFQYPRFLP